MLPRRRGPGRRPCKGIPVIDYEFDTQLAHTIWEMERTVRSGGTPDEYRRVLLESHAQQIRHIEELSQVPRHERTQLMLQVRPAQSILLLPAEGSSADELQPLAEAFFKRGFAVLNTNLSTRVLDRPGFSPSYWQTCLDEILNRVDALAHYATSIEIVGVGLSGLVAVQAAAERRVAHVAALFPPFEADPGLADRMRVALRKLFRRDETLAREWPSQRRAASRTVRATLDKAAMPLYLLLEDRDDRSPEARAAKTARKLVQRGATQVRFLRPGEASGLRNLPPAVFDEILGFLRPKV